MLVHDVAVSCAMFSYVSIDSLALFSGEDYDDPAVALLCLRPLLLADILSISYLIYAMLERNLAIVFVMYCRTAMISSAIFYRELVIVLTSSLRLA
jgi:hypothetical protein